MRVEGGGVGVVVKYAWERLESTKVSVFSVVCFGIVMLCDITAGLPLMWEGNVWCTCKPHPQPCLSFICHACKL